MKLLLFDIDGTLIRSDGAGRMALRAALEEMFGTAGPIDEYKMSGKTDARIVTDLLTAIGMSATDVNDKLPLVYDLMAEKARQIYPERKVMACPGVPELLQRLGRRADVVLGLLTGNARQTAPLKLIMGHLDPTQFPVGAYGSDHADRNHLPALAMQRAEQLLARPFSGDNTVIVGDTPADILCARAGGATAVAVASGWHATTTLAQYHPDHLFENLSDTDMVVAALLEGNR
ncbi:MAG: HAD hydrolase-like protein [Chloroflexota bacterium]|nr:HAD family hydrolase [Anaerolineales bacterium]MCB8989066.1 HAD family hydrolase [Ardenticatenaceae bacterium]